ncbi:MAG: hypothetical protein KAU94_00930 [Verrucomicrobia bacterium]|nr:hypothetical protein [Verrucomicrobiota bacterium]
MKRITSLETDICGAWIESGNQVHGDETCERVKWLSEEVLVQLAFSREFGAWETLFKDPDDNRLWERHYPQGELQGGGPPALRIISEKEAREKYDY